MNRQQNFFVQNVWNMLFQMLQCFTVRIRVPQVYVEWRFEVAIIFEAIVQLPSSRLYFLVGHWCIKRTIEYQFLTKKTRPHQPASKMNRIIIYWFGANWLIQWKWFPLLSILPFGDGLLSYSREQGIFAEFILDVRIRLSFFRKIFPFGLPHRFFFEMYLSVVVFCLFLHK